MATPSHFVTTEDKAMITVPCRISSPEEKQFVAYHYCYVLRLPILSQTPYCFLCLCAVWTQTNKLTCGWSIWSNFCSTVWNINKIIKSISPGTSLKNSNDCIYCLAWLATPHRELKKYSITISHSRITGIYFWGSEGLFKEKKDVWLI